MAKQRPRPVPEERTAEPLPLPEPKKLHKRYYAGLQLISPQGGVLEPLRVRHENDGSATVIFECTASSLRYALPIPKASRPEKAKVKEMQGEGLDPHCPRHGPGTRLLRAGRDLVCTLCGIPFAKV